MRGDKKLILLILIVTLYAGCHWIIAALFSGKSDTQWHQGHCDFGNRYWCHNNTAQCCFTCNFRCPG